MRTTRSPQNCSKTLKCFVMKSRWETSRRPLFVKTVWADGYHHAVLFTSDSIEEDKFENKQRRVKSALCQTKNPISNAKAPNDKCLNISTVKILLAGIRNLKEGRHTHNESANSNEDAYTIDVIPDEPIKLKNLNNEILFASEEPIKNKFYNKSRSLEYNDNTIDAKLPSKPNASLWKEELNNSLSERVMVWLDLAAQNREESPKKTLNNNSNNISNNINNNSNKTKKRGVTAHVCFDLPKKPVVQHINKYRDKQNPANKPNGDDTTSECTKTKLLNTDNSILKSVRLDATQQQHKDDQTSSVEKTTRTAAEDARKKPKLKPDTKRQIHIFLPNTIPKKVDCDSSLSIKSSALTSRSFKRF